MILAHDIRYGELPNGLCYAVRGTGGRAWTMFGM